MHVIKRGFVLQYLFSPVEGTDREHHFFFVTSLVSSLSLKPDKGWMVSTAHKNVLLKNPGYSLKEVNSDWIFALNMLTRLQ